MNKIIELNFYQMAAAYIFIIILIIIVKVKKIPREKQILISSIRMTVQLILTGYVLVYIFDNIKPIYTLIYLFAMEAFAIYTIFKMSKTELSTKMKKIIVISMLSGTLVSLFFFLFVVIGISPWYDPRYFIPIAGMLVGNSMTGISLGVSRLIYGMNNEKNLVETALMLGASPKASCKNIVNNAFDSAILPTINSMVGMGIISLPGMMTGQILSGIYPLTAIFYQIAIMLGILGSVSITVILLVQLGYKTFFNSENQLIN